MSVPQSATAVLLTVFVVALSGCPAGLAGVSASTAKAITAFGFLSPAALGTVMEGSHAIDVTVPFGTNVTALVATFSTDGASVKAGSIVQVSGTTPNDFTSPFAYTVLAADGSAQNYVVTVTIAPSSAKAITAFGFLSPAVFGTITEASHTIDVTVPFGTNITALVAAFTTTGASVKVGSTAQVNGTTANNFTSPVVYVVRAADSSTQSYTVTVTVALNSAKAITAYSIGSAVGTIVGTSIAVTVPFGTNVTALVATFTTTGASVKVGSTAQVSGTTANNFTSPVTYVVRAADSSTQSYTVTVTVQAASTNALLKSVALVDSQSTAYSLVPTFSSTTFSYTGVSPSFPQTAVTATLTVTPQDPSATITSVTETNGFGGGTTVFDTHVGNVYAMTLTYYHTIVTIVLTAQDGVTTKTYSIDYILLFWRG